MIPPPKPWQSQTNSAEINAIGNIAQSSNFPSNSSELPISSGQSSQYPSSYMGNGFGQSCDSYGYGMGSGMNYGGYGMGGGYGAGFGGSMFGGYGGGFGGMYNPIAGPFMEIEQRGQMLYILGSRVMETIGALAHMTHTATTHFSGISQRIFDMPWFSSSEASPNASTGNSQEQSEVSFYYDSERHTYPEHNRLKLLKSLGRWLLRAILFIMFYLFFLRLRRFFATQRRSLVSM
ncbi:hypothetical protein XU18_2999 [Perkinsela sp. CCAP 1560/4]|nr:hypothetical protein XU18_2999 [Perkinsela sp. CCAP 1560/4]|eukprot:KNH06062.1 hypothetical protein XU18_2999 [Perkinsela sp. CCAP 1560/4]